VGFFGGVPMNFRRSLSFFPDSWHLNKGITPLVAFDFERQ